MGNTRQTDPNTRHLELGTEGKIAGVLDGLANYLGVDVTIVRIAAVVAIFATAGFMVLVYLIAWGVMPKNSGQTKQVRFVRSTAERNRTLAWGLLAIGILIAIPQFRWFGISILPLALIGGGVYLLTRSPNDINPSSAEQPQDPGPDESQESQAAQLPVLAAGTQHTLTAEREAEEPDNGFPMTPLVLSALSVVLGIGLLGHLNSWWSLSLQHAFALTLLASGAGLLVAAFTGRAPGLIVLGLVATLGMASAWILDPIIQDGAGQSLERVTNLEELEPEYRLGAGELVLDFSDLDLEGTDQIVKAHLETGSLRILVPEDVDLVLSAKALAGEVTIGDEAEDGYRAELFREIESIGEAQLTIEAEVTFGEIIVNVSDAGVRR